jgi:hypothetical protein
MPRQHKAVTPIAVERDDTSRHEKWKRNFGRGHSEGVSLLRSGQVLFKDGKLAATKVGALSKAQLIAFIDEQI